MRATSATALLLALLTAACAGKETPAPASTSLLDKLPRVANSTAAPCRLQREIAAQNAYLATVQAGKETVYKAPCDVDPKPAAPKPAPAKAVVAQVAKS